MDDEALLNQELQDLVKQAQHSSHQSIERQRALNKLIEKIVESKHLGHPQKGLWNTRVYADLYNEALQKTLMEVCEKIDNYHPKHPVMAWVNQILNWRFIDVVRNYLKKGISQIPKKETTLILSLDDLDKDLSVEDEVSDAQRLREFIQEDPEGLFRNTHIPTHPDTTFQKLVWYFYIEGKKAKEISQDFGFEKHSDIYQFLNRKLKKFIPYFRKYLQE